MNKFIFDVDGTLTPSRRGMDGDFQNFFLDFCYANDVYLVTGSDYPKTVEQVGSSIAENVVRCYNCNGNDVWEAGINVRTNEWILPEEPHQWLSQILGESQFSLRTGLHFEHRPGMVNFSIIGRNATQEQRAMYVDWDKEQNERNEIAQEFNHLFPGLEARVGGETGIDISPKGFDKSQIVEDFTTDDVLYFFGDAMHDGGNDYPLAQIVDNPKPVTKWSQTWEYLQQLQKTGIAR